MTFGLGTVTYSELYDADNLRTIAVGPNNGATNIGLRHLPSDAAADLQLTQLEASETYIITSLGTLGGAAGDGDHIDDIIAASDDLTAGVDLAVGMEFTIVDDPDGDGTDGDALDVSIYDILYQQTSNTLTDDIEAVQAKINTARVQAGSQYAALESAVNYTTDLTAQYELGYNTVNDVNSPWRQLTSRKINPTAGGNSNACASQPGTAGAPPADPVIGT